MTKSILLHVGAPKTGTTALQYLAANHSGYLAARGVCYPVYPHEIAKPVATLHFENGNADAFHSLRMGEVRETLRQSFDKRIRECSSGQDIFILSSENLFWMEATELAVVRDILASLWPDHEVKIFPVLVVRDLLEHGLSWWAHTVRRHASSLSRDDYLMNHYDLRQVEFAETLSSVFGHENLLVVKYMRPASILKIALRKVGVKVDDTFDAVFHDLRFHRSLAPASLDVLRKCEAVLPEGSWVTNFEGQKVHNEIYWDLGDFLEVSIARKVEEYETSSAVNSSVYNKLVAKFGERLRAFNSDRPPIGGELKVSAAELSDGPTPSPRLPTSPADTDTWIAVVSNMANTLLNTSARYEAQRARIALVKLVRSSGIFDDQYYLAQISAQKSSGIGAFLTPDMALSHFLQFGWQHGLKPCPFFDPAWYMKANPDLAGAHPVEHYISFGAREGRSPSPDILPEIAGDFAVAGNLVSLLRGAKVDELRRRVGSGRGSQVTVGTKK